MRYAESHLNKHCIAWQDPGFIQVAAEPVLVLARASNRAAVASKINGTRRLWVAQTGCDRRRTLIRGNQSISGEDLAWSLQEADIPDVVIVRYGQKCLASHVSSLFDLVVPRSRTVVHYVDWGVSFALPAREACSVMFRAKAISATSGSEGDDDGRDDDEDDYDNDDDGGGGNYDDRHGTTTALQARSVVIHPMFIPLGQRWMEGHGSLEIRLKRPRGASTWVDSIIAYPRTMHAIKALSSINFARLPCTIRGMQQRLKSMTSLLKELQALFGQEGAECGWRLEFRVGSFDRPDPDRVPAVAAGLQGVARLSDFLVRSGALAPPGIEMVRITPEQYFRPLQHAMACIQERGVFGGRASDEPTSVQKAVMADLQSMFGVFNPQVARYYGRATNMWYPSMPSDLRRVREPDSEEPDGSDPDSDREPEMPAPEPLAARRRSIPPHIAALADSDPEKYACMKAIVAYGCLVPHPRAKPERNVTSRGNRGGGLLPARETYIEAAEVLYETLKGRWEAEHHDAPLPPAYRGWWRQYITTKLEPDLDRLFARFEDGKREAEHRQQRDIAAQYADKHPDQRARARLFAMEAAGIALAKRGDYEPR